MKNKDIKYYLKQAGIIYGLFGIIFGMIYLLNQYMPEFTIEKGGHFSYGFMTGILIALFVKIIIKKTRKDKYIERDERTNKIGYYALSWSWTIVLLTACAIMLVASIWGLNLSGLQITTIFFVELLVTGIVLQQWFYKKGDINC
ncbi:MAG: hypothetical protein N4A38_00605 [Candidatus Gracilibacteria bacterium]|nr:hypothetical protein [Candidatus Gracilibacteria bacterium]